MKKLKSYFLYCTLAVVLAVGACAAAGWYWVTSPVSMQADRVDYHVEPGSTPARVAREMRKAGIQINADLFVMLARLSGRDVMLKAGAYEVVQGDSPWVMLERMASGDMTQARLTLVEGWTYQRIRQVL